MHAFLKGATISSAANKDKATTSKPTRSEGPKPWVEKYRPKTVDEVAFQEEIVAVLKKSIERMDLPNLLFYGPPGTGKTSTILAAARELFGHDMYRSRVLELNASDERGIQVIRDKVKKFAQLSASGVKPDGKPCPPFKIIILDEADSMTSAAQAALRRTMEKECKTTRFCLICNYISRIIEPLTSRCSKFRFKPLDSNILKERLEEICKQENIIYDEKAIDALIKSSEGDMRKAITYLQSVYRLKGSHAITENDVLEIAGIVPQPWIDGLISVCHSGSYEKLEAYVKNVMLQGHACNQIISQLHDILIESPEFTDSQKSIIFEKIAICDKRLQDGADEYLQLMDSGTVIMQQLCSNA